MISSQQEFLPLLIPEMHLNQYKVFFRAAATGMTSLPLVGYARRDIWVRDISVT